MSTLFQGRGTLIIASSVTKAKRIRSRYLIVAGRRMQRMEQEVRGFDHRRFSPRLLISLLPMQFFFTTNISPDE